MNIVGYVYNRATRHRRRVYRGKSIARASEANDVARDVICLFGLSASLEIVEQNSMGVQTRRIIQEDYLSGRRVESKESRLKLAM